MPIRITDIPEPFTPASRAESKQPPLIESDAYRRLVHELRRYCAGALVGRSFLISGHRGSGKTTLVFSALEALLREQATEARGPRTSPLALRPLPVPLQGPTLLPGSPEDFPVATDGTGDPGRRLTEMENVLAQITLGLHRALAREMVLGFQTHVGRMSRRLQADPWELLELAAQLQLELDDYSGRTQLRDIWRRAGALRRGVLYSLRLPGSAFLDGARDNGSGADMVSEDQGLFELLALASLCEAYRRASGKATRKDEIKAGSSMRAERALAIEAQGKALSTTFMALLAGGAAGSGTLAAGSSPSVATFAGALTALASAGMLKVSVGRVREQSDSREALFIPDLSVGTMDRVLPVLLDRVRDAGLAPVFVVDELDKVDRLEKRIPAMIRRLKKLVAERACFCFLTDRKYFEQLRQTTLLVPYSIEHTYFTHQLFIAFRHTDMRSYLEKILERPVDAGTGDPTSTLEISEEQADHAVLPYILLHGSQMHPIDLLRQVAQLRDANGNVALERGAVRSRRRYQLELLMQLAIELQLEQEAMQEELDRRPAFRRLAHDAVYYIAREWESDADTLSLDDDALGTFAAYLVRRMDLEKQEADPQPPAGPPAPAPPLVNAEDLRFLWSVVRALAEALAAPATIQVECEKRNMAGPVLDAIGAAVRLGPLLEATGQPHAYRWKFRRSGRTVQVAQRADAAWREQAAVIREFESALSAATEGAVNPSLLSTGLGILPTSPAWPSVKTALDRLATLSGSKTSYPEMEEDAAAVTAFFKVLQENVVSAARAIYWALVLSPWSTRKPDSPMLDALEGMSAVLDLSSARPEQVGTVLAEFGHELAQEAPPMPELAAPRDAAGVRQVIQSLTALAQLRGWEPTHKVWADVLATANGPAWHHWRERLQGRPAGGNAYTVISAIASAGPFALLRLPVEAVTAREWSRAFLAAVTRTDTPKVPPPEWLAMAALRGLGWGARGVVLDAKQRARLFGATKVDAQSLEGWGAQGAESSVAPFSAFILSTDGALSESWRPEPQHAVLVLREKEWAQLETLWKKDANVLAAFGYDWTVRDWSASAPSQTSQMQKSRERLPDFPSSFIRGALRVTQTAIIVGSESADIGSTHRRVVNPRSLSDLSARLTSHEAA